MTRKDYIAIAKVFNNHAQPRAAYPIESARLKEIADGMADIFIKDNGAFDYRRFITACGF